MDAPGNEDRLMTAREAARYLGYAEGTVRNKASSGELPSVKLGTALRFRLSDLDKWVREQDALAKGVPECPNKRTPEEQETWDAVRAEDVAKRRAG